MLKVFEKSGLREEGGSGKDNSRGGRRREMMDDPVHPSKDCSRRAGGPDLRHYPLKSLNY
jgi:hypothetical protein